MIVPAAPIVPGDENRGVVSVAGIIHLTNSTRIRIAHRDERGVQGWSDAGWRVLIQPVRRAIFLNDHNDVLKARDLGVSEDPSEIDENKGFGPHTLVNSE
jgi:hypothetical protein